MFLWLLYPLHEDFSFLNVIRYITFRSAYAGVTALVLSFVLGPPIIRWLSQVRMRQIIRRDGPTSHYTKEGTPTMGGLIILAAIVIPTILWGNLENRLVLIALIATVWLGTIGFLDDWLKIQRVPKGLLGRYKLVAQGALGLGIGTYLYFNPVHPTAATITTIPFLKNFFLDLGIFYIPFVAIVITGASNAVNLTDGLDGLATGTAAMAAVAFAGLAYLSGHARFSEYLNILFVREAGELTVFLAAMVGAALGFLWFNTHPAQVFMGDTGSLALGGALGTVAVLIKREFLLVVVGGIFVLEALSVIVQVASYKLRKKRILKMAPLHHHFELSGWAETKVVVRFWIVAALFALLSLSTLKLQ
ncbi:MAG TPA: phospho-N-acetylmuramoyl-pentapeptide-transferase [Candidatus Eisenbacteria bacterium]